MEQKNSSKSNDGLAAVFGITLLVTFKYLPILIGVAMASMIRAGAKGARGANRIKQLTLGAAFFSSLILILFGLPGPVFGLRGNPNGVVISHEKFPDWMAYFVMPWNRFWNFPLSHKLRFDLSHVTFQAVTNYFWLSIVSMFVTVLASEIWSKLKNNDATERDEIGVVAKFCRLPRIAMYAVIYSLFGFWVLVARRNTNELSDSPLGAFSRVAIKQFLFLATPYLIMQVAEKGLSSFPLASFYAYLIYLPSVGFFVGFLIGITDLFKNTLQLSRRPKKSSQFYLGEDFSGKGYGLSDLNLSYHVEIIAPTGSGKTNLLKNIIADRIQSGHGIIFLDLKAEFQVVEWMMRAARSFGREGDVRLLSLANRELSVPYSPIKFGSAPEIHSQLMNSMTWSEDYYRKVSSMALMTLLRGLCENRDQSGELFHLGHLYELLNEPGKLREFGGRLSKLKCASVRDIEILCEKLDRPSERDKLTGLTANIGLLIFSAAGELIGADVTHGSFDFKEAVNEGKITYVLMNSMKLRETASVFGKMILQDLMRLAGDRYSEVDSSIKHRPVTLVIDEFAAFAIPEFIEFMDRARGAGIGIVFAHQSRADLRVISPEFQERVEANANTVIVSGIKSSEDAEYFAGQLGTKTVKKETRQVGTDFFGDVATGMKSVRDAEEYIVHPNKLKSLHQGEVFTVSKTVDPKWGLVKVPKAPEFMGVSLSSGFILSSLKQIRAQYMSGFSENYLELTGENVSGLKREPLSVHNKVEQNMNQLEPDLWN